MGLLLIACTATSILSAVPLGSTLDRSNYLNQLAASDSRVIWTALIEFAWAATGAGIAIGLYPVIRRHNRALALGSVAGRVAEGVLVLIGTLSLLVLLTVSQESLAPGADAAAFRATGDALLAVRGWAMGFVGMLPFLTAALMYYYSALPSAARAPVALGLGVRWRRAGTGGHRLLRVHPGLRLLHPQHGALHPDRRAGDGPGRVVAGQRVQPVECRRRSGQHAVTPRWSTDGGSPPGIEHLGGSSASEMSSLGAGPRIGGRQSPT